MSEDKSMKFTMYGTTQEYDKLFDEIYKLDSNLSANEINEFIRSKLSLIISIAKILEYKNVENFTFYRIRLQKENEPLIDESSVASFNYPPITELIKRGRANLEKEQVFYACGDSHTPFHELAKHIDLGKTIVYLSKWGVKPIPSNIHMHSLFFGVDESRNNSYASLMAKGVSAEFDKMCKSLPTNLQSIFLYYQKKYTELFTSSGNEFYHISSAIAHQTFYDMKNEHFDTPIIMYPAVAKNKDSVNFAIRKDFADNFLYLKEVDKMVVTEISETQNTYTPISRGIPNGNNINWLNLKRNITIHFEKAAISYDISHPVQAKYISIDATETLTQCCPMHAFTIRKFYDDNKISDDALQKASSEIPIQAMDFIHKKQIAGFVYTEMEGDLFLTSKLSESKRITFIRVPVTTEYSYE